MIKSDSKQTGNQREVRGDTWKVEEAGLKAAGLRLQCVAGRQEEPSWSRKITAIEYVQRITKIVEHLTPPAQKYASKWRESRVRGVGKGKLQATLLQLRLNLNDALELYTGLSHINKAEKKKQIYIKIPKIFLSASCCCCTELQWPCSV